MNKYTSNTYMYYSELSRDIEKYAKRVKKAVEPQRPTEQDILNEILRYVEEGHSERSIKQYVCDKYGTAIYDKLANEHTIKSPLKPGDLLYWRNSKREGWCYKVINSQTIPFSKQIRFVAEVEHGKKKMPVHISRVRFMRSSRMPKSLILTEEFFPVPKEDVDNLLSKHPNTNIFV